MDTNTEKQRAAAPGTPAQTAHALVISRKKLVRGTLQAALRDRDFDTLWAEDGQAALKLCRRIQFGCVIVDGALREAPLICASIKESALNSGSRVLLYGRCAACPGTGCMGGDCCADDIISGEGAAGVISARAARTMREAGPAPRRQLRVAPLTIYPEAYRVELNGKEVRLTPKEFELLLLLCDRCGKAVTYKEISRQIWKYKDFINMGTIYAHVRALRRKLRPAGRKFIRAIPCVGYTVRQQRNWPFNI